MTQEGDVVRSYVWGDVSGKEDRRGCFGVVVFQCDERPWRPGDAVLLDKLSIGRVKDGWLAEKRGGGVFECILRILRVSSWRH